MDEFHLGVQGSLFRCSFGKMWRFVSPQAQRLIRWSFAGLFAVMVRLRLVAVWNTNWSGHGDQKGSNINKQNSPAARRRLRDRFGGVRDPFGCSWI